MDTQVIHVDLKPFFQDHICEDMIHECLEGRWGVAEAKNHDGGLIEAKGGDKCCFPLIFFSNVNVIITPSYIKLVKRVESFMSLISLGIRGRGYPLQMVWLLREQ